MDSSDDDVHCRIGCPLMPDLCIIFITAVTMTMAVLVSLTVFVHDRIRWWRTGGAARDDVNHHRCGEGKWYAVLVVLLPSVIFAAASLPVHLTYIFVQIFVTVVRRTSSVHFMVIFLQSVHGLSCARARP